MILKVTFGSMQCYTLKGTYLLMVLPELRDVTCHMGHTVTSYPTQVNVQPQPAGQHSIYLPQRDGRLSWPRWLATCPDGLVIYITNLLDSSVGYFSRMFLKRTEFLPNDDSKWRHIVYRRERSVVALLTEDTDTRIVGFSSHVKDNLVVRVLLVEKHRHVVYRPIHTNRHPHIHIHILTDRRTNVEFTWNIRILS